MIVAEYGALGVLVATLIEEIIAPIPSPIVPLSAGFFLLPMSGGWEDVWWPALFIIAMPVSVGITIGSLAVYGLGYAGGKPVIEKSRKWIGLKWDDLEKIEKKIIRGKGDEIALFLLRVLPIIPGVAISVFCGIVRYPPRSFLVATWCGAFVRAFLLGIIGWYVGGVYAEYAQKISEMEKSIFIVSVIIVALGSWWAYLRRKKALRREESQHE